MYPNLPETGIGERVDLNNPSRGPSPAESTPTASDQCFGRCSMETLHHAAVDADQTDSITGIDAGRRCVIN